MTDLAHIDFILRFVRGFFWQNGRGHTRLFGECENSGDLGHWACGHHGFLVGG